MSNHKGEIAKEVIRDLAARFFAANSTSKASLITITKVDMPSDRKTAKIFFTTYPETEEVRALAFAKRNRSEFRDFMKKESLLARIPFIDFEIDVGERNRQKIEDISREAKS